MFFMSKLWQSIDDFLKIKQQSLDCGERSLRESGLACSF